jgi:hypothetical protein
MRASLRESLREAGIFRVEENGSESCELSTNSSFVLVRVPIRVEGEGQRSDATFSYSIGSSSGRETPLPLRAGLTTILRFRIPLELFHPREHLIVKILARTPAGEQRVLWLKRWEAAWQGKAPSLHPMAD